MLKNNEAERFSIRDLFNTDNYRELLLSNKAEFRKFMESSRIGDVDLSKKIIMSEFLKEYTDEKLLTLSKKILNKLNCNAEPAFCMAQDGCNTITPSNQVNQIDYSEDARNSQNTRDGSNIDKHLASFEYYNKASLVVQKKVAFDIMKNESVENNELGLDAKIRADKNFSKKSFMKLRTNTYLFDTGDYSGSLKAYSKPRDNNVTQNNNDFRFSAKSFTNKNRNVIENLLSLSSLSKINQNSSILDKNSSKVQKQGILRSINREQHGFNVQESIKCNRITEYENSKSYNNNRNKSLSRIENTFKCTNNDLALEPDTKI